MRIFLSFCLHLYKYFFPYSFDGKNSNKKFAEPQSLHFIMMPQKKSHQHHREKRESKKKSDKNLNRMQRETKNYSVFVVFFTEDIKHY